MSHIKTIEIKNFKSIRHQKIEDCRRVNVFIGYPNVGKSNILEALGLYCVDSESLKKIIRVKEDPTIFFDGLIDTDLSVSLNKEYLIEGKYEKNEFNLIWKFLNRDAIVNATGLTQFEFLELYRYRFRSFNFSSRSAQNDQWKIETPKTIN